MSFEEDSGDTLFDACTKDAEDEGMSLAKAAGIVRNQMFSSFPDFQGSFDADYIKSSVPLSLVYLVRMLLEGTNVSADDETIKETDNVAQEIAQLIRYNATKRRRDGGKRRHNLERETPLPIYVGVMLHAKTRKASITDRLAKLGLCIPSDRIENIKTAVTETLCERYKEKDLVCPPCLQNGLFTTAAIDNIDHNATSTTAQQHFHGTGISLFQHPDEATQYKLTQYDLTSNDIGSHNAELPEYYTDISPVAKEKCDRPITLTNSTATNVTHFPIKESSEWLQRVELLADKKQLLDFSVKVSWSAFNEEVLAMNPLPKCLSALMPLIDENINSLAMVKHTMKLVWKAVSHLSPGQTPVITADQPVYALGKQVQWQFPEYFGEDKFVFMMGGLHIEMATLSMIGDWLEGSEWSELLVAAQIHSCGTADSILSASHVKRSRYAHQVSLAALHLLLKKAFSKEIEQRSEMSYDEWVTCKREKSVQFEYWQTVLDLEALLLLLVRSIRLADFEMFVDALEQIIPWMFALDHVHYSRWLPFFVQNLKELPIRHQEVHKQFLAGKFTVQKTNRKFSSISDDQAHEQNNKIIKDDGGAIGILHSPKALMRWMVGGPEVARMISQYNESMKDDPDSRSHHENTVAFEKRFRKDVRALVEAFEKEGNPFEEEDDVLLMAVS